MSQLFEYDWNLVKAIFDIASELPLDEQDSYVNSACTNEWTKNEVRNLLATNATAFSFLETSVISQIEKSFDLVGAQIGSYKVLKELGQGGMSKVYLAQQADGKTNKRVAIKVLWPELHSSEMIDIFHREFQLSSQLNHPNIVQPFDHGTTENGQCYTVIEYIDGASITRYCDRHKVTIIDRLHLFLDLCQAVEHAHLHQIVHLDLKPTNILVTVEGILKLIDFGIARNLSSESLDKNSAGSHSMTPVYASPEQILGKEITSCSDIYSLGIVLYELIGERKPFNLKSKTFSEIKQMICEQRPPKLSEFYFQIVGNARNCSQLNIVRLINDLDEIIFLALQKSPSDRYSSVTTFCKAVQLAMANAFCE